MNKQDFEMRNVPAADIGNAISWPLSTRRGKDNTTAYKLYFYLLSRSAINWGNRSLGEKPYYYITDNHHYWKRSEAAKSLGCTPRTITNNLNRLMEEGLITQVTGGFRFDELQCWAPVHWDIMKCFMNLGDFANWEMMIRFYSVLIYAASHGVVEFTLSDIVKTFGLRGIREERNFLKMCLHWWQHLGLLSFSTEKRQHPQLGEYTVYIIRRIENKPTSLAEEFANSEEDTQPITNCWTEMISKNKEDFEGSI